MTTIDNAYDIRVPAMNLRDLRYLLALVEHEHFGRAAAACRVSQPTLSVQIRKLEETLGVVLFERAARAATPTEACRQLLGPARDAVAASEAILAGARNLRDPLSGPFRLGIIPTLAPYLLPLIFAPLRQTLPALLVEPWEDQTAPLLARLRAHELDAVLLATEEDGPDLASRPLFEEPFLAALPPDHPLVARPASARPIWPRTSSSSPTATACATRPWPSACIPRRWAGPCGLRASRPC